MQWFLLCFSSLYFYRCSHMRACFWRMTFFNGTIFKHICICIVLFISDWWCSPSSWTSFRGLCRVHHFSQYLGSCPGMGCSHCAHVVLDLLNLGGNLVVSSSNTWTSFRGHFPLHPLPDVIGAPAGLVLLRRRLLLPKQDSGIWSGSTTYYGVTGLVRTVEIPTWPLQHWFSYSFLVFGSVLLLILNII